MGRKTRLALVGRGYWGKVYIKTISNLPQIELQNSHIYGKDFKRIKKISPASLDGVVVAVSTDAHYKVAKYLLENGFKNILIEKPLTKSPTQSRKIIALMKLIPDSRVMMGHIMLYDPALKVLKKNLKKIGTIEKIEYTSLKGPKVKDNAILQDGSPHPIYLFSYLLNKKPKYVSAKINSKGNIMMTLGFGSKQCVAYFGSNHPKRVRNLTVIGSKGTLTLNDFTNPRTLLLVCRGRKNKELEFGSKSPLECELLEFISILNSKKKIESSIEKGHEVVAAMNYALKSALENGKVMPIVY